MPRSKRIARNKEKYNDIINKASKLFVEKGYHQVTMDQIAEEMGVSKLSIYYYFESKEELLFTITKDAHTVLIKNLKEILATDAPPQKTLEMAIRNHIIVLLSIPLETASLRQRQSLLPENRNIIIKLRDQYDNILRGIIKEGIKQKIFIDCDIKLAYLSIIGSAAHIAQWFSPLGPLSIEEIADYFSKFSIRGILRKPPQTIDFETAK